MNVYLWMVYLAIVIVSFLPLTRLDLFSVSKKYAYFKYVSISLFIWTLILGASFVVDNSLILYLIFMIKYPIVFFATAMAYIAFMNYLKIKIPKWLLNSIWLFFTINLVLALSNGWHQWYMDTPYSAGFNYNDILESQPSWFFMIHTVANYVLLFVTLVFVIRKMYRSLKIENDAFPFFFLIITVITGIIINFFHVFIYTFILDPTLIIFVIFISIMYFVFYIRDVRLIIRLSNQSFILNNLREMFLIVNHRDEVVDASKSFKEKFSIDLIEGVPLKAVMDQLETKSIVYTKSKNIVFDQDKLFIHMKIKDINMPLLKYPGHMILFYDETTIQKYIHDMDYVMNHDLMTDLYNRNYLEMIRKQYNLNIAYGCIIFDLDGLKLYNDYLGHIAGDNLLKRFSSILKDLSSLNEDMISIRMGGDEFLLIIDSADKKKIEDVIQHINKESTSKDPLENIGFSYGYAIQKKDEDLSIVLSKADINMYQMKATREEEKKKLENILKEQAKKKSD